MEKNRVHTSQISLVWSWTASEGTVRMRRRGLRSAQVSASLGSHRERKIIRARSSSSDSDSLTEKAENGNPGKPERDGDFMDVPEASLRRDAVSSDGCIAEFLPLSEQKVRPF